MKKIAETCTINELERWFYNNYHDIPGIAVSLTMIWFNSDKAGIITISRHDEIEVE